MTPAELTERVEAFTGRSGLAEGVTISQEKFATLAEFWPLAGFLYDGPTDDPAAREKWLGADQRANLATSRERLAALDSFSAEHIDATLREQVERGDAKPKDVFQPLRVAIAGAAVSPGVFESLAVLGREESLQRIDIALAGSP